MYGCIPEIVAVTVASTDSLHQFASENVTIW